MSEGEDKDQRADGNTNSRAECRDDGLGTGLYVIMECVLTGQLLSCHLVDKTRLGRNEQATGMQLVCLELLL